MPSRFRDAYLDPTNDERPRDVWPTRPSDAELWDAVTAADVDAVSDVGELGTIPQASAVDPDTSTFTAVWKTAITVHHHQLCGHDCRPGACSAHVGRVREAAMALKVGREHRYAARVEQFAEMDVALAAAEEKEG